MSLPPPAFDFLLGFRFPRFVDLLIRTSMSNDFCVFLWLRSKRVIGLDDLLDDFYAEESKNAKAEVKRANVRKRAISDYGDHRERDKEALLSKFVDECEKQVKNLDAFSFIICFRIQ